MLPLSLVNHHRRLFSFLGSTKAARPSVRSKGERLRRTFCVVGFIAASGPLGAFTPPTSTGTKTSDLADIPLEELMQLPVEFVTGASKYEQTIQRAPASVTVLTSADIQNFGWQTLSDALRSAPGFFINSDRFYDYIGNRGFTRSYDYNSRTLVLINGHRINDSLFQQGSIGTDFILDLDLIDRIEIIRGPSSSLYGSSAFYGAINIIPKKGRDFSGGQTSLALGSEPSVKGRATVGNRTASGVEYTISATEWWSQGEKDFDLPASWRANTGLPDTVASDRDSMHHQSVYANAAWKWLEVEGAYVKRRKDVLPQVFDTNLSDPSRGTDQRGYFLTRVTGHPNQNATLTSTLSFDYFGYDALFSPAVLGFNQQMLHSEALSLNYELRFQQSFGNENMLIAGFEYEENLTQIGKRTDTVDPANSSSIDTSSRYGSPFAQIDWNLTHGVYFSTGARYDKASTGEEQLTPRTGLIWNASPSTDFKLLYGQAFRVPNLYERSAAEGGTTANPNLGPETNESWEFILAHKLSPIWRADAHLYYIKSKDLITDAAVNGETVTTEGLETGLTAYFPSNVQLRGSATFQHSCDANDRNLVDAPRTLLKLNASAPIYEKWLRASAEIQYVGDRLDGLRNPLGDYLVGNLTLRALQVWHRWDFSLSVYNIGNARWQDSTYYTTRIQSAPGSVELRAILDF
jgi:outer membrane receptor for ferrienterochelin and colicins